MEQHTQPKDKHRKKQSSKYSSIKIHIHYYIGYVQYLYMYFIDKKKHRVHNTIRLCLCVKKIEEVVIRLREKEAR